MTVPRDKNPFSVRARWLVVPIAAAGLSGCMASAIDSSASLGVNSGTAEQTFAFSESDFSSPRPQADVGGPADTQPAQSDAYVADDGAAPEADNPEASMIAMADPTAMDDDFQTQPVDSQTVGTDGEPAEATAPVEDATAEAEPGMEDRPVDTATARINAATGSANASAKPAPMVSHNGRSGGLLALFSNNRSGTAAPRPRGSVSSSSSDDRTNRVAPNASGQNNVRPLVALSGTPNGDAGGLPGVDRARALGLDAGDESAEDGHEEGAIQLASAAGMARVGPNGLIRQTDRVDIGCLKPALVRVLKQVEYHYGKPVIVTSGFRSPPRNKRAGGAKNSLHMYCSAADIQIEGVSKWELAKQLRSMPGRGGVGTYCHTDSVHVDIGPKRDWNWRCRRR